MLWNLPTNVQQFRSLHPIFVDVPIPLPILVAEKKPILGNSTALTVEFPVVILLPCLQLLQK